MNGLSERQTAKTFEGPEYRFLVVANKFQTGFDQPLLHTMYVDKKLGGVNAVQTLSRLNRTFTPEKKGTMVLDFANEGDAIRAAFEPYFETTLLSEATDPNLLYESQGRLLGFPVYTDADVDRFARVWFDPKSTQDQVYAALEPALERGRGMSPEEQQDFRGQVTDYVRLYAFLAQVLTFTDKDFEKLYAFLRQLRRLLPTDREELPREVQQNIDIESYRIQETGRGPLRPQRNAGILDPVGAKDRHAVPAEVRLYDRLFTVESPGGPEWKSQINPDSLEVLRGAVVEPSLGDAEADIGMLRMAGVGVAVGNAHPEVKAAADWVAPSAGDAGLAAAVRRFVLNA